MDYEEYEKQFLQNLPETIKEEEVDEYLFNSCCFWHDSLFIIIWHDSHHNDCLKICDAIDFYRRNHFW